MPSKKVLVQKKEAVVKFTETLRAAKAGVLVDYRGLTVEQDTALRNALRAAGVEYKVIKNTLTNFAIKEVGLEGLESCLAGPTSWAVSATDEIAPAKVMAKFAKEIDALEIKGGFLDSKVLSIDEITTLSSTPSYDVLISKLMGSMTAPIAALARTLQAIVDKDAESGEVVAAEAVAGVAAIETEAPAAE